MTIKTVRGNEAIAEGLLLLAFNSVGVLMLVCICLERVCKGKLSSKLRLLFEIPERAPGNSLAFL